MDRDEKYQIVKKASMISFLLVLLLFGTITYLHYQKERNTFENLDTIIASIKQNQQSNSDLRVVTREELEEQARNLKATDVPLDEVESVHDEKAKNYRDELYVIKYLFSLAILGDTEGFFEQFDPNTSISDFPDVKSMQAEQQVAFNNITRGGRLEHIRILNTNTVPEKKQVRVEVELVYKDEVRRKLRINLTKMEDEHAGSGQWFVSSSVHDLIKQINN